MTKKNITTPVTRDALGALKAGDEILLSGVIYTARDAAHKRLSDMITTGKRIPLDLKNAVIYYAGPTPPRPGRAIGSCGPTTSSRMDAFTPALLKLGLRAMIGKGDRSTEVRRAIRKNASIYFLATGGIGALLSTKIISAKAVLFKELGPEAVYRLEVRDFPLIVGIDSKGRDIYDKARRKKR
ncbi:MAG: Fe-S-containing hydro-lyase [Candidatus Omnitrophica bacterium]|nr:Fe-S-containing hydro-lyase [Candidatus Omnitrophota bacterium]MBU1038026.1 Fe-S-containing hydro-lyase [Candidatus Omnitrophota bacterium]MBU1808908.1 Fe-S-containing hydro-lyase [Candidatus Omnitrophota bacterium]